jgi:hypothetical protein
MPWLRLSCETSSYSKQQRFNPARICIEEDRLKLIGLIREDLYPQVAIYVTGC